jgi:hypothetical protein
VECCRLLQRIRSETLDMMDAVKRWRRSKFNMALQFMSKGQNLLLRIVRDLDFIDRHELVVATLGFRMHRWAHMQGGCVSLAVLCRLPLRCLRVFLLTGCGSNPFVMSENSLCPNPFSSNLPTASEYDAPPHELLRAREAEQAIMGEAKRHKYKIPPPSPNAFVNWALARDSSLPEEPEFKTRSRELRALEERLRTLKAQVEQLDGEVMQSERMVRPLERQLQPLEESVMEAKRVLRVAETSGAQGRIAKARAKLHYHETEQDSLEALVKVSSGGRTTRV